MEILNSVLGPRIGGVQHVEQLLLEYYAILIVRVRYHDDRRGLGKAFPVSPQYTWQIVQKESITRIR